ncbi:hypothetical protein QC334_10085 [Streptomyces sp. DH18]|uniref:hypothetical protein n=1 Tax=Streptomyces sp. DH18 TaxID=3040126 RepID=UPI0024431E62|nr:hypothetical protein [Streptomyces sp. DH18]MDG9683083.1 hypothetical protein [Streptomyces sp. DH18]
MTAVLITPPPPLTNAWQNAFHRIARCYERRDLHTPQGADLLQVLWCPFDHQAMPRTALFWRSAATVTDILTTPPSRACSTRSGSPNFLLRRWSGSSVMG